MIILSNIPSLVLCVHLTLSGLKINIKPSLKNVLPTLSP